MKVRKALGPRPDQAMQGGVVRMRGQELKHPVATLSFPFHQVREEMKGTPAQ